MCAYLQAALRLAGYLLPMLRGVTAVDDVGDIAPNGDRDEETSTFWVVGALFPHGARTMLPFVVDVMLSSPFAG
jgi:hypothetical protein